MSLLCFTVNFFSIPPLFTGCIFDVFRYQSRITFESKAYQRRSGASLNRESPGGEALFPRLFPPPVPFPVRHSFMQAIGYQLWWGNFEKKVYEKFGKGIKFALSLHPLKRNEGGETRGRRVHAVAAFWRCWRRSFPAGPFKRGREKKSLKKLRKRFGGNDKNALSLHPLSLLKKRRRWRWQEEFFNNIDVKITT